MAEELELKAIVGEPAALRARLVAAGARPMFRGLMEDRLYDRAGALASRNEVLRVRHFRPGTGPAAAELTWKGPTRRSADGYKLREEVACRIVPGSDPPERVLEALGFGVVQAIDRYVELYELAGAVLRLEWYPRMDLLLEVEGPPAAIETAIAATGIPRAEFSADPLIEFVRRYEPRVGRRAVLALADLGGERPAWEQP
jgi:adenylate cyclase class IV